MGTLSKAYLKIKEAEGGPGTQLGGGASVCRAQRPQVQPQN